MNHSYTIANLVNIRLFILYIFKIKRYPPIISTAGKSKIYHRAMIIVNKKLAMDIWRLDFIKFFYLVVVTR